MALKLALFIGQQEMVMRQAVIIVFAGLLVTGCGKQERVFSGNPLDLLAKGEVYTLYLTTGGQVQGTVKHKTDAWVQVHVPEQDKVITIRRTQIAALANAQGHMTRVVPPPSEHRAKAKDAYSSGQYAGAEREAQLALEKALREKDATTAAEMRRIIKQSRAVAARQDEQKREQQRAFQAQLVQSEKEREKERKKQEWENPTYDYY